MDTQADSNTSFGRAAVRLGIEGRVLSNGVLPEKRLAERAAIVSGMVAAKLEEGHWADAVNLVYGVDASKALFDDDKSEFVAKVVEAIKPEHFGGDSSPGNISAGAALDLLAKHGHVEAVRDVAMMGGLTIGTARDVLWKAYTAGDIDEPKGIPNEQWKEDMFTLGSRIRHEEPQVALEIFQRIENPLAIKFLYKEQLEAFSLDKLPFLFRMAGRDNSRKAEIVVKALDTKGADAVTMGLGKGLGLYLYEEIYDDGWGMRALPEEVRERLEDLAVLHLDKSSLRGDRRAMHGGRRKYAKLELKWAKRHWKQSPSLAYQIFRDDETGEVQRRTVVACAQKVFEATHRAPIGKRDGFPHVSDEYVREFMPRIRNREVRLVAALRLEDNKEVRRLSKLFETRDPQRAYGLRFDIGEDPSTSESISRLRDRLYSDSIREAKAKDERASFYWLRNKDVPGFEVIYDRLMDEDSAPAAAFELAQRFKDEARKDRARDAVLAKYKPEANIHFFRWNAKDRQGYERATMASLGDPTVSVEDVRPFLEQFDEE